MTARRFGKMAMLGAALTLTAPLGISAAHARPRSGSHFARAAAYSAAYSAPYGMHRHYTHWGRAFVRYGAGPSHLQCVPFARENTGIELSGNAANWWAAAEGVYERGARPEVGSILNFRATGRMRMGHVAVVSNVVDSRTIEIDQANWWGPDVERGGISHDITVVDVSPINDWSQVRVALGHSDELGSVYPTYGFIYDRPDTGAMVANSGIPAGSATATAAPASDDAEEVAEAEDDTTTPHAYHHRSSRHGRYISSARAYRIHSRAEFTPHHSHPHHRRT